MPSLLALNNIKIEFCFSKSLIIIVSLWSKPSYNLVLKGDYDKILLDGLIIDMKNKHNLFHEKVVNELRFLRLHLHLVIFKYVHKVKWQVGSGEIEWIIKSHLSILSWLKCLHSHNLVSLRWRTGFFLSFINLGVTKTWQPKKTHYQFASLSVPIQRLLKFGKM
jgi:hypothetical protein